MITKQKINKFRSSIISSWTNILNQIAENYIHIKPKPRMTHPIKLKVYYSPPYTTMAYSLTMSRLNRQGYKKNKNKNIHNVG